MIPELRANLVDRIGKFVTLRKVAAHEWAGACVVCGGRDRLRVHDKKGWFCRKCIGEPGSGGHWGDYADFTRLALGWTLKDTLRNMGIDRRLSPEEVAKFEAERKAAQEAERQAEAAKQAAVHSRLTQSATWQIYNRNLDEHPQARRMWNERGLSDDWIEYYRLGYCPPRSWYGQFTTDSLTIPYFRPQFTPHPEGGSSISWQVMNLKHRLLMDDPPMGKYLPETAGAGNHLFYTDLTQHAVFGDLLIVEGEIKAMVTWASMWIEDWCIAPNLTVIGVPGQGWREDWLEQFNRAERVFICLDPDAQTSAARLAKRLDRPSKNILLPDKVDDLITAGVIDGFKLYEILEG
jgi:hypothetical protein